MPATSTKKPVTLRKLIGIMAVGGLVIAFSQPHPSPPSPAVSSSSDQPVINHPFVSQPIKTHADPPLFDHVPTKEEWIEVTCRDMQSPAACRRVADTSWEYNHPAISEPVKAEEAPPLFDHVPTKEEWIEVTCRGKHFEYLVACRRFADTVWETEIVPRQHTTR